MNPSTVMVGWTLYSSASNQSAGVLALRLMFSVLLTMIGFLSALTLLNLRVDYLKL
jgi:hypothetical protein